MTAPRAKRRTTPFRTLEELGTEMLNWHRSAGDPIYAAGSYFHSGKRHPSRATEEAAERELTKTYDNPHPSWTKKDMNGLWRAIITLTRLLEFDPKSKRDITLRRKVSSRDAVGSPEREALLRAVGLSPERGVRYNITTPQLRQMVKSGQRIRVGRDPASASPRRVTKKRWTYVVEDLETGQRRTNEPTMKSAKQLARLLSTHGGHPVAVIAVTTVNSKDEWHPQGAYYGTRWRGGAHHYTPRGRR